MPRTRKALGTAADLSGIDRVIHDPARLAIVSVLRAFETADVLFLLKQTESSRGNPSSHLSELEAAGYVDISKKFVAKVSRTLVRLTDSGRRPIATYRAEMNRVLANL